MTCARGGGSERAPECDGVGWREGQLVVPPTRRGGRAAHPCQPGGQQPVRPSHVDRPKHFGQPALSQATPCHGGRRRTPLLALHEPRGAWHSSTQGHVAARPVPRRLAALVRSSRTPLAPHGTPHAAIEQPDRSSLLAAAHAAERVADAVLAAVSQSRPRVPPTAAQPPRPRPSPRPHGCCPGATGGSARRTRPETPRAHSSSRGHAAGASLAASDEEARASSTPPRVSGAAVDPQPRATPPSPAAAPPADDDDSAARPRRTT